MPLSTSLETYKGLGAPLVGKMEFRGTSLVAADDFMTLTASSGNTGDLLVLRSFVADGSTSTATELFVVNSSGVLAQYQVGVTAASSASSALSITAGQTGQVILLPGFSSGVTVGLPAPALGLTYKFFAQDPSSLVTISASVGAAFIDLGVSSAAGSSNQAIVTASTIGVYAIELVAISTLRWAAFPHITVSSAFTSLSPVGDVLGRWVIGSTIA